MSYVVESTVDGLSPDLRFTFRVVEVATDRAVLDTAMAWERRDLIRAPEAVSRAVGEALRSELGIAAPVAASRPRPAVDPEAWDRYLVGKALVRLALMSVGEARGDTWQRAHDNLERATELAPAFTEAYAQLAILDVLMFWLGEDPSPERIRLARESRSRAVQIDGRDPLVRLAQGYLYYLDGDWTGALAAASEAEAALAGEIEVLLLEATSERRLGLLEEAAKGFEDMVAGIPTGGAFYVDGSGRTDMNEQTAPFTLDQWRGLAAWANGDTVAQRLFYDRAVEYQRPLVEDLPENGRRRQFLAWALAGSGRRAEALREDERALELDINSDDRWSGFGQVRTARVRTLLLLGENEAALDQLEEIFNEPYPYLFANDLKLDPTYDPIRREPRFQAIVSRTYGSGERRP